ncbi:hypothetical protein [Mycolicibacterium sp. 050158]|uniref:hypothetical protein n=1 Tax=Mycolicibacterium sp. 050158 TaxID=3090602 RepID=UPI00299F4679|nr:hypothetical protein [Mycolicibacterium sp. 050158]MDX1891645.1 hypothetical protein [Mycolicibacterium sp. 050158]
MNISKKNRTLWVLAAGAALAIAAAPSAAADPILPTAGNGSASDAVAQLQAAGYTVSLNFLEGTPNVPLRECKTQAISDPGEFATVSVDISCPNAK